MPSRDNLIQASIGGSGLLPYGLQDMEQLRLILEGDSVVDWRRLAFRDKGHVDEMLATMGMDLERPEDLARFTEIHHQAVTYYQSHFERELAESVNHPEDFRDLFLIASRRGESQLDACMTLKIMHIIHHAAGREILYRLPIPLNELFHRIEKQVFDAVDGMKAAGVKVTEYAASRKTPSSIITKLLCQVDTQAAQVHDRLRFRIVTETLDDLLGALVYCSRYLIPFNFVVPGESRNDLVDLEQTMLGDSRLRSLSPLLQVLGRSWDGSQPRVNRFTDQAYRDINFVVDMAVRIDEWMAMIPDYSPERDGGVGFLLVEFQIVDRETHRRNNRGKSRHGLYKARQRERALERLRSGVEDG